MKRTISFFIVLAVAYISTFINTVNFDNYFFIQSTTYTQLAVAICAILIFFNRLIKVTQIPISINLNVIDLAIIIFVIYITIRFFLSPKFNSLINSILMIGIWGFIYGLTKAVIHNKNKTFIITAILYLILFLGCIQIIYTLFQCVGLLPVLFNYRIGGSFGNPGDLSNFLVITYIVALGLLFIEKNRKLRIIILCVLALHLVIIIYSLARTAWIAVILTSIFFIFFSDLFKLRRKKTLLFFKTNKWVLTLSSQ